MLQEDYIAPERRPHLPVLFDQSKKLRLQVLKISALDGRIHTVQETLETPLQVALRVLGLKPLLNGALITLRIYLASNGN